MDFLIYFLGVPLVGIGLLAPWGLALRGLSFVAGVAVIAAV